MQPTVETGWSSKTGLNVTPPLVDFQTPPAAVAAYQVSGSPGTPQARQTRPPAAGPMLRNFSSLNSGGPSLSSAARAPAAADNSDRERRKARGARLLMMFPSGRRWRLARHAGATPTGVM